MNDVAKETNILPEGLTINSIAGPWTTRDRVPLVTVIRDYETKTITLSQVGVLTCVTNLIEQRHYLAQGWENQNDNMIFTWIIPFLPLEAEKNDIRSLKELLQPFERRINEKKISELITPTVESIYIPL